jgi:hypothetical protein
MLYNSFSDLNPKLPSFLCQISQVPESVLSKQRVADSELPLKTTITLKLLSQMLPNFDTS